MDVTLPTEPSPRDEAARAAFLAVLRVAESQYAKDPMSYPVWAMRHLASMDRGIDRYLALDAILAAWE